MRLCTGGETGRDEIGSPAANIIQQLQSDNHTLREQLAQAQAAAAHATLLNEDKVCDTCVCVCVCVCVSRGPCWTCIPSARATVIAYACVR